MKKLSTVYDALFTTAEKLGNKILSASPEELDVQLMQRQHFVSLSEDLLKNYTTNQLEAFLFLINDHEESFGLDNDSFPNSTLSCRLLALTISPFEMNEESRRERYLIGRAMLYNIHESFEYYNLADLTIRLRTSPIYNYGNDRYSGAIGSFSISAPLTYC